MGVEIECIIENRFNTAELIKLPLMIDNEWRDLKGLIEAETENFIVPIRGDRLYRKASKHFENLDENYLENYWKHSEEDHKMIFHPGKNNFFFCYFGMVSVYRKTIVIKPFGLSFKSFKGENLAKRSLVIIVREIAKLFDASKVLYCPDSSLETSLLSDMAMKGKSLAEIIELGESKFGIPSQDYQKGIDEAYYVDYMYDQL